MSATTEADLLEAFGRIPADSRFDLVVLVGHASTKGIRLTGERPVTWRAAANWLAPFRPRVIAGIACELASWPAIDELFTCLPTLQEVIGSPTATTLAQAQLSLLYVAAKALGLKVSADARQAAQFFNFATTGGFLIRRTRSQWKRGDPIAENAVDKLLGAVRQFLRSP